MYSHETRKSWIVPRLAWRGLPWMAIAWMCCLWIGPAMMVRPATAQTSYAMLMSLHPVAIQQGTTAELELRSRYSMHGAIDVLVSGHGVEGEPVLPEPTDGDAETPKLETLTIRFTAEPDAPLGVRDFRLITATGASTVGQLVVVRDPVVIEEGGNDRLESAQMVTLPAAICGAIEKAEDVDYYRFQASAGATYTFHVRGMRLQDRIHDLQDHLDPILTLRHHSGQVVAASDNYFSGDPLLVHHFAEEGEYLLEIRDVRYSGNQFWQYCIEASDLPLIEQVHPFGLRRAAQTQIELIAPGWNGLAPMAIDVCESAATGPQWLVRSLPGGQPVAIPVVISDLPQVVECEDAGDQPETAQSISVPSGISGRITSPHDVDCYRFTAQEGESFSFEIIARRHQSQLDSHLRILDLEGNQLAANDDLRDGKRVFADSRIESWTAPSDGEYLIEVRDLHLGGGPNFGYYLQVDVARPHFKLYLDTDKTNVSPGTSGVIFVRAERFNGFDGAIQLAVDGLPAGVTAHCGRILSGQNQDGCIVLQAAKDAQRTAGNIRVTGHAIEDASPASDPIRIRVPSPESHTGLDDAEAPIAETPGKPDANGPDSEEPFEGDAKTQPAEWLRMVVADVYQEVYQPGGGRGHWPVEMHTVAVTEPGDLLAVTLSTCRLDLAPGESQRVEVTLERAEGFDQNVTLDVIYQHLAGVFGNSLPPGVTVDGKNSKTLLTGQETSGHITFTADPDAESVQDQQIAVMANVSINFVMKATYASDPLLVTVPSTDMVAGSSPSPPLE
jgi:hypothetical protein